MALITGFDHDIFISYAHVDNLGTRWIEKFHENLITFLAQRFGRLDMVKIWWDKERLDGGIDFNDAIANAIEKSAVLICLNSPGYRESEYCKQELELFHLKVSKEKIGLKIEDRPRIINILLDNEEYQHWLPELGKTTGFRFNDDDFALETDNPEFKVQMKKLVKALETLLRNFGKRTEPAPDLQGASETGESEENFTIFLGDVPDTLSARRSRISAELENSGYKVLTDIPPPYEAEAHEKMTKEALAKADLAVHLMDRFPGRKIDGKEIVTYPQKQAEISLEASTPSMIWVPDEVQISDIEDENHRQFLLDIENSKQETKTFDFIRGSQSNISHLIIESANEIQKKKLKADIEFDDLSVLLDTHTKDIGYASELSNTLLDNSIRAFLNPNEGEPEKHLDQLEDRISRVKKLIFMYGSVTREWLLERISVALRIIISGGYNVEDFIVYMSPPFKNKDEIALNQRLVKLNIIDGSNYQGIDQSILNELKK